MTRKRGRIEKLLLTGWLLVMIVGSEAAGQVTQPQSQVIPVKTNFAALAAWQLEKSGLTTDVREGKVEGATQTNTGEGGVELSVAGSSASAEGFVNYVKPCYDNTELHFLITVNTNDQTIDNVQLEVAYSPSMSNPRSRSAGGERNPDEHNTGARVVIWREAGLPANTLYTQSLIFDVQDPEPATITVTLSYTIGGAQKAVLAQYALPSCFGPNTYESDKIPAILCHPAEEGCSELLPNLGFRFNRAQAPQECSFDDPERCANFLPALGVRFRQAYPDLLPGECRVLEDNVIAQHLIYPDLLDSLLRDGDPASPLTYPLWESGQEFRKKVVHPSAIDGVKFFKEGRRELKKIHNKAWGSQTTVLTAALEGAGSLAAAESELDQILKDYKQEVEEELKNQAQQYEDVQSGRKERYEPLIQPAVDRAKNLIAAACNVPPTDDGFLESILRGPTKRAYEGLLELRRGNFEALSGQLSPLPVISAVWEGEAKAALREFYDNSNEAPLKDYVGRSGARSQQAYNQEFAAYLDWQAEDERLMNEVHLGEGDYLAQLLRLQGAPETMSWERALDFPKQRAMSCFINSQDILPEAVELSACESGPPLPEEIIQGAPFPVKANDILTIGGLGSDIAPPDTEALEAEAELGVVNPGAVTGVACRGLPGDPYWSSDCSCNCGSILGLPGGVGSCPVAAITRHDRNVATTAECLAELDDHFDPVSLPITP